LPLFMITEVTTGGLSGFPAPLFSLLGMYMPIDVAGWPALAEEETVCDNGEKDTIGKRKTLTTTRRPVMKKRLCAVFVMTLLMLAPSAFAQMEKGMGPGMMEQGQPGSSPTAVLGSAGAKLFAEHCAGCHPDGGNVVDPDLPLTGSRILANFRTFQKFLRHPQMPDGSKGEMPAFSRSTVSDRQARMLYHFITGKSPAFRGGYGRGRGSMRGYGMGPGMMGGYGMDPGSMRGYGMGPGMMGGYGMDPGRMGGYGMGPGAMGGCGMGPGRMGGYGMGPGNYMYSPECQKFYDETASLRKELHDKRFEYFEAMRNPKTTGEAAEKLAEGIRDLQKKIFSLAPLGCRW
jgi:mono/diheme cytochrome c family protein